MGLVEVVLGPVRIRHRCRARSNNPVRKPLVKNWVAIVVRDPSPRRRWIRNWHFPFLGVRLDAAHRGLVVPGRESHLIVAGHFGPMRRVGTKALFG